MKNLSHWIILVGLMACALCLSGCANTPKSENHEEEKVSNLPWNKPEKWERSAPVGGAAY